MNKKRIYISLFFVYLLSNLPILKTTQIYDTLQYGAFMPNNFSSNQLDIYEKNQLENATLIDTYKKDQITNGYSVFAVQKINSTVSFRPYMYNLIIINMNGEIIGGFTTNETIFAPEYINSTTFMFAGRENLTLWNIVSGTFETTKVPSGHHDMEYNPFTDTFMILSFATHGIYNGLSIRYDDIYEYDNIGNVVWYWNCSEHLPFDQSLHLNETAGGFADWTHANTLFWDFEEDNVVYYNPRNLDTFYKINKTTGEFVWAAGKLGNFTLYDINGNEKESLWYHSHSVEKIGKIDLFYLIMTT